MLNTPKVKQNKTLSVLIATYNGEKYLRHQLESIAAQSDLPDEIVVSDDCSTDNTVQIVEDFSKAVSFPVSIHINASRKGYRSNFLDAVRLCQFDLVAFCDQDDIWHLDKVLKSKEAFDDEFVQLVHHNARVFDNHGNYTAAISADHSNSKKTFLQIGPFAFASGFTTVFRRSLDIFSDLHGETIDNNQTDVNLAHDQWFFFLASVFGTISYIGESLADYRQHGENLFGYAASHKAEEASDASDKFRKQLQKNLKDANSAINRSNILLKISKIDTISSETRKKALFGAKMYSDYASWQKLRSNLYGDDKTYAKLSNWIQMINLGAYKGSTWSFDKKSAIRDVMLGVAFPSLLNK